MKDNNLIVLTGGPSSGKTTTLEELKKQGFSIQYEWARIYIDKELKKGKTIKEIREDEVRFQEIILKLKIDFEKNLEKNKLLFMERGIPDTTAYLRFCGINKNPLLDDALKSCYYRKVFLLEMFKFKKDYARTENEKEAIIIENLLKESYEEIGISVIKVPKMSVKRRAEFILQNI
ncbi:ATP-binding protein [Patescibacteria group bacterium]|nr:ATP-binding protein [Patescibacteria group bacterium]